MRLGAAILHNCVTASKNTAFFKCLKGFLNCNAQLCKYSLGWFFVAGFLFLAAGQLFVALLFLCFESNDEVVNMSLLRYDRNDRLCNDAMCCICRGKNRDAKNHRSGARGGVQNTEEDRNGLKVWGVNEIRNGVQLMRYPPTRELMRALGFVRRGVYSLELFWL